MHDSTIYFYVLMQLNFLLIISFAAKIMFDKCRLTVNYFTILVGMMMLVLAFASTEHYMLKGMPLDYYPSTGVEENPHCYSHNFPKV